MELNFADVSAGSKVLISTRMKALLEGGHQMEVGLPSPSDSARMLLSAAGVEDVGARAPTGVDEIVDLCGRLPLALGIAGRLAASLDLVGTQDWSDMIGVLKEELRESHSGGAEGGMIRASLKGLKGSPTEQANVRSLLLMFALVPEDTYCPLEVLLLMYKAVHEGSTATIMHIRKYLRILINRSLVLGTIDRPSVHDLVLDFAVAQHSDQDLQLKHRQVVEAFRAARPADAHGRCMFDSTQMDDPLSVYVGTEIEYHVSKGWSADMENDELAIKSWLTDYPRDEIVVAAGRVFGLERMTKLARAAEASKDWWLAARYWAAIHASVVNVASDGTGCVVKALEAMESLGTISASEPDKEDFVLELVAALAGRFDAGGDLSGRPELIKHVLSSPAAARSPLLVGTIRFISLTMPPMMGGDVIGAAVAAYGTAKALLEAAESDPDPLMRNKCRVLTYGLGMQTETMVLAPGFEWDHLFGKECKHLKAATEVYNYDGYHELVSRMFMNDWYLFWLSPCLAPALHYGDLHMCYKNMDEALVNLRRVISSGDYEAELMGIMWGPQSWATLVHSCRMSPERHETMAMLLASCDFTFLATDAAVDKACSMVPMLIRVRGDKTKNGGHFHTAEAVSCILKCVYVLVAADPRVSEHEITQWLPSVEDIQEFSCPMDSGCGSILNSSHGRCNSFLMPASVCAKLNRHTEALSYCTAGLSTNLLEGGTLLPSTRIELYTIRGRALAALGRTAEASTAFEAAIDEAHRYGFFLHEAFAIRDLKVSVYNDAGHGEHGSRRLGAALRQLVGPADLLTELLDGFDAAEMMAKPEPERGYEVSFETEEPARSMLRQQLQQMRLTELRQRAQKACVDDDTLDD
eukprot:COSAG06_NODE_6869_length_2736_cov_1.640880_1_plen_864_part_01